jgi:hypothetical protein
MSNYLGIQAFEIEDLEMLPGLMRDAMIDSENAMDREAEAYEDPMAVVQFAWDQLEADSDLLDFEKPVDFSVSRAFSPDGNDLYLEGTAFNKKGDEIEVAITEVGFTSSYIEVV